jgi:hypothetical protein
MNFKRAFIYVIALLFLPVTINAQETKTVSTPIFVTPYKPTIPTYSSGLPSVVKTTNTGTRSTTRRTNNQSNTGGPTYDAPFNPYKNDARITSERSFYDAQTDKQYDQYDYFALLAKRGDTQGLAAAVRTVQENGVFDPAKYQAAIQSAVNNNTTTSNRTSRTQPIRRSTNTRTTVAPQNAITTPQKVHQGYDDEAGVQTQSRRNGPIFLR